MTAELACLAIGLASGSLGSGGVVECVGRPLGVGTGAWTASVGLFGIKAPDHAPSEQEDVPCQGCLFLGGVHGRHSARLDAKEAALVGAVHRLCTMA